MDARFFGTNLLALNEVATRQPASDAVEDAYYARFEPRTPRLAAPASMAAAAVCLALVAVGILFH